MLKQADQCGNSNKVFFVLFCKDMQSFFDSHQTFSRLEESDFDEDFDSTASGQVGDILLALA